MIIVCVASGPSLAREDVAACAPFYTIAINESYRLAPWADILYAADYHWWDRRRGVPEFDGLKFGMQPFGERYPLVNRLERGPMTGLSLNPKALALGANSGYQAINLAVHFGASRIVLLGYDMQPAGAQHHWHEPHPGDAHPDYDRCLAAFDSLPEPLTRLGISVFNASRSSALTAFPRVSLREVLYDRSLDRAPVLRQRGHVGGAVSRLVPLP